MIKLGILCVCWVFIFCNILVSAGERRDIHTKRADFLNNCNEENLIVIIRNSCRFRRNDHAIASDGPPKQTKSSPSSENAQQADDDDDIESLLKIVSNGMELVEEWKQIKERRKKEIWKVEDPNEVYVYDEMTLTAAWVLDMEIPWLSEKEKVKLWKRLMRDAAKSGGKVRRNYELVYHCCLKGCSESDFKAYC